MGIWTLTVKPEESTRCITDLNYVLTMQCHRDYATHHVAEKDHQATQVSTSRQGSERTVTKKIKLLLAMLQVYKIERAVQRERMRQCHV